VVERLLCKREARVQTPVPPKTKQKRPPISAIIHELLLFPNCQSLIIENIRNLGSNSVLRVQTWGRNLAGTSRDLGFLALGRGLVLKGRI
jgi:hypothetical protein